MNKIVLSALVVASLWMPVSSSAQGLGSIAGVAKDSSGAVLPGVTVTAASTVLIEKSRSAVTDGSGQYSIVSLPPGKYAVTFELSGFSTMKREGIELAANFTATINGDLKVGTVAETITVTGQSPMVDVQGVTQSRTVTAEVIKSIPIGGTMYQLAAMNPGVTIGGGSAVSDVGGASGSPVQAQLSAHGGAPGDESQLLDGIQIGNMMSNGGRTQGTLAPLLYEQIDVQVSGQSGDVPTLGVVSNLIPRSGGNSFDGSLLSNYSSNGLQSGNLTDRLKATGLTATSSLERLGEINGALGGPIVRDRVWFFGMGRYQTNQSYIAGLFFPVDPTARIRVSDPSRQADDPQYLWDSVGKVTIAATQKMRFTGFAEVQRKWWTYWQSNALYSPESLGTVNWPGRLYQTSWTYTPTNRLLIEAGANFQVSNDTILPRAGEPNTGLRIVETGGSLTGPITYGPFGNIVSDAPQHQRAYRASVSYVTGANNLKVGMDMRDGFRTENNANFANDVQYRTTNFVLNQVSVFAPLGTWTSRLDYNLGIYAQDRWTLHRLTVTAALRLEDQSESNDPYTVGPSTYLPTRNRSDAGGNVLNWKELNPRAGVAYDVFGNGKTAWKFSAARGVAQEGINTADTLSYARRFGFSAPPGGVSVCGSGATSECTTRTVNDAVALGGNGNGLPDCDLLNPAGNGECGPRLQPFGTALPTTSQDPATLNGWFKRPWNWEFSTSVQHELSGRVSVGLSYFRRINGNFLVTDNLANTASDFRQFSVVVPAGLPNAGASLQAFDISPSLVSATNNLITYASNYGNQYQHYNGVDLTGSARLVRSAMISGGLTFGKIMTDNCEVVKQLPEALGTNGLGGNGLTLASVPLDYCHAESGWVPQVKLFGSYLLPGAVRVSGNFQSLPGPMVLANVIYTGASLASAIGGPFSQGAGGQKTVQAVQPGSLYGDRLNQLDLRFSKVLKLGGKRTLDANFDLYNAINSDAVLSETTAFGATWRRGTAIVQGRIVKLGFRLDF